MNLECYEVHAIVQQASEFTASYITNMDKIINSLVPKVSNSYCNNQKVESLYFEGAV